MKAMRHVSFLYGFILLINGVSTGTAHATAFENGLDAYHAGDYQGALRHFKIAAARGYVRVGAQHNLGVMYDNGVGVPEDDAIAVRWFRRAAEKGYLKSQSNLGLMYANGEGVLRDDVQAFLWFDVAARRGNQVATRNRDVLAKSMTSDQIDAAQRLADKCIQRRFRSCGK
jgi:uncharacterized protein